MLNHEWEELKDFFIDLANNFSICCSDSGGYNGVLASATVFLFLSTSQLKPALKMRLSQSLLSIV